VASDGTIYWAVADGLAKSLDHGVTWTPIGGGFVNDLHPIEVPGGLLVTAKSDTLVVSSDGGARWEPFGPQLPYVPAGVVYSENQKSLFIWHWDCGTRVLPDAIQKLSYDFAPSAGGPIARPGPAANAASPATVQLRANWVSPTYLAAGQSVTIYQDAFADQNVTFTLSVDILDSQGQRVLHSSLDSQALAAQQTTPFSLSIPVPTSLQPGTYVVNTAALGSDGSHYAARDSAGTFVVSAAPATPAPVPTDDTPDNPDQPQSAPFDDQ
jgi:methionine-rich copper-binding protein CopC